MKEAFMPINTSDLGLSLLVTSRQRDVPFQEAAKAAVLSSLIPGSRAVRLVAALAMARNKAQSTSPPAETPTTLTPVKMKAVPDVTTKLFNEAKDTLEAAGFKVDRIDTLSEKPENIVVKQDIFFSREGSPIPLHVSVARLPIRSYIGMNKDVATQQLTDFGLKTVETLGSTGGPVDVVEDQTPLEGSLVSHGDTVTLTILQA
jgi:hypothetical protein